ncbi:hypothetical protein ACFQX7_00510 [Luedemannella flava]
MGAKDDLLSLGALDIFHSAKALRSSVYGSSDPDRDVRRSRPPSPPGTWTCPR